MPDEGSQGPEGSTDTPAVFWPAPEPAGWSPPVAPQPERRGKAALALTASFLALILITAGIGIWWGLGQATSSGGGRHVRAERGSGVPTQLRAVARKVAPGVVDVNTFTTGMGPVGSQPVVEGAGTGMVLTSSGEVLTNNHVIQGATVIKVSFPGHQQGLSATVIGVDPAADVALLQIQGISGLPTVTLGSSSSLRVGQSVIAIGNALGRGGPPAVTGGVVSALDRSIRVPNGHGQIEHLTGLVQSDARISPGDSGGPLADGSGQVVGMMTAAATRSSDQRSSRQGYAIPIESALGIVNQIRAGHASHEIIIGPVGFLGVAVRNVQPAISSQLGLPVPSGALVVGVTPGSPAARAGISKDSVITAIDGRKIRSVDTLGPVLHSHQPGEQIEVTWVDQNRERSAKVRLIAGPAV